MESLAGINGIRNQGLRYRYLGVLKSEVLEVLAGISDVSLIQRQEMIDWAKRFESMG